MTSSYPDYVKTNLDWFSEVPSHWSLVKVAWHLPFVTGWTPSTSQAEYFEGDNTWVSIEDMKSKVVSISKKNISDQAVLDRGMPLVPKGSLLFSFKLSVGKVAFAGTDLYTNEAIAAFLPNNKVSLRFLYYAAPIFLPKYGQNNIYGSLLMNRERIERARTFVPPIHEQEIISNYLDREVGRIDDLVSEKKNFINLLKEKRQAMISHAVTKGLDPNVKMKDSGVEWIGDIPKHWSFFDGKRLFKNRRELSLETDEHLAASQKYGVVPQSLMMQLNDSKVMLALKGTSSFRHVEKDDFVISLRSFEGGIEHSKFIGCVSPAYTVLSATKDIVPGFYRYLFKSNPYIAALQSTTDSLRDGKSITFDQFGAIPLVLPKIDEQQTIANFLDHQTAKIDNLVKETEQSIQLLKERRTALISAAVTGKIDVRDWEVNA